MKVTDEQIKKYCKFMGYKLLHISKISFAYRRNDNWDMCSLLKASACSYELHECPTCGFVWKHGFDGSHSCSNNLKQDARRWRALMSSERIRFIGSARLGKETGQVLCVEFHQNIGKDAFTFKLSGENELSHERLKKYTDAVIKNNLT